MDLLQIYEDVLPGMVSSFVKYDVLSRQIKYLRCILIKISLNNKILIIKNSNPLKMLKNNF